MSDPLRAGRVRGLLRSLTMSETTPPAAAPAEEGVDLFPGPSDPKRKKAKKRVPAKKIEDDELFVVPPEVVS